MSIENYEERLERAENWVKNGLWKVEQTMRVEDWKGNRQSVTLLQIYGEWMDYLVKNNFNKKEDNLLKKWQNFLLERNSDAIVALLTSFFEAKRRYWRDQQRWEDKRDWCALCKNYYKKWWWQSDEDLIISFFSSYSAAERRIRTNVKKGKMLSDTSKSLLQTIALTKAEMIKKEEEKKRKAEEKARKEEEKKKRIEERAKKAEEKKLKKAQKQTAKKEKTINNEIEENLENEDDKEVDSDYPKAPEWRSGPTDPWFEWTSSQSNSEVFNNEDGWKNVKNGIRPTLRRNDKWQLVDEHGQTWLDFGD